MYLYIYRRQLYLSVYLSEQLYLPVDLSEQLYLSVDLSETAGGPVVRCSRSEGEGTQAFLSPPNDDSVTKK